VQPCGGPSFAVPAPTDEGERCVNVRPTSLKLPPIKVEGPTQLAPRRTVR